MIILLLILSLLMPSPVYAAEVISVKADGLLVGFSVPPVKEKADVYVSMEEMAGAFSADYIWDVTTKSAILIRSDIRVTVNAGQKLAYINAKTHYLDPPPWLEGSAVMVPVGFLAEAFGAEAELDEKSNTLLINTGKPMLSVLDRESLNGRDADKFTYKEALSRAVEMNSTIRDINENIEYIELSQSKAKDSLWSSGAGVSEVGWATTLRNITALENQLSNVPLQEQIQKDVTEYTLINCVTNIEGSKMDILLMEESIKLEEITLKNLELKHSLGLASDNELKQARLALEQNVNNLSLAKIQLESDKQTLKRLLGYDLTKEIVVEYEPETQPATFSTLNAYISTKTDDAPTIKMLIRAVDEAQFNADTIVSYSEKSDLDRISTANALNKARRELSNAEADLDKAIRTAYNNLVQLEEKAKSLALDLDKAKDSYNMAVLNYEAGNVTLHQVNQARLGILNAEIAIEKNEYSYAILAYGFNKPYLLKGD